MSLYRGAYLMGGSVQDLEPWELRGLKNVPNLIGESVWALLSDTMWGGHPYRVTRLVRRP